ncbi:MAG: tRNA-dihydrouridine synthase family protein [Agitococcus sp.]
MKIILAPMEGLTDVYMRDILTAIAGCYGYDWCVTEFIRITQHLLPAKIFYQYCPELLRNSQTAAGTPVHIQLLGSDPQLLAENAQFAVELGAPAIDLNFGCPAKSVNNHRGGAVLLQEPETLHQIVLAVRKAVPQNIPVSAKMRLGYNDRLLMLDNALAIESAGANWLTVHARTKVDGYRPPAHWHELANIRQSVSLPVIANGDVDSLSSLAACLQQSQCQDVMIGRGAVSRPDLVSQIKTQQIELTWPMLVEWQLRFLANMYQAVVHPNINEAYVKSTEKGALGRYKQWLAMLSQAWPQAQLLFEKVKRESSYANVVSLLRSSTLMI